jgi:hypothetical protein
VPERISRDRYFLSLYCAPVCDPDLLLPGPVIQPEGGTAFYPNGFVADGKLYVAYTYPRGIHCSVIEPLPDFSRPFLLPRGGRAGLKIDSGIACFGQRQSSLGLVLTEELTRQPKLRLAFDVNVHRYPGLDWPVLVLGGKTRGGTAIRAISSESRRTDVFQIAIGGNQWADIAPFQMKEWNHFEVELMADGCSVRVNNSVDTPAHLLDVERLRVVAVVPAPVPHVALAETPDHPISSLVDTRRQIAIAEQQALVQNQQPLVRLHCVQTAPRLLGAGRGQRGQQQGDNESVREFHARSLRIPFACLRSDRDGDHSDGSRVTIATHEAGGAMPPTCWSARPKAPAAGRWRRAP